MAAHPGRAAAASHVAIALAAVIAYFVPFRFLSSLAPHQPTDVLATAWQVHGGFSAIAFAGLVMLIDMAGRGSNISNISERRFLLKHTRFLPAFTFALIGSAQMSAVSTWFATDQTVVIEIICVVIPTIYLVGKAYLRAIHALTLHGYVDMAQKESLREHMKASMDASHAQSAANSALAEVVERVWVADIASDNKRHFLVTVPHTSRLIDVHLPTLSNAVRNLEGGQMPPAGEVKAEPTTAEAPGAKRIGILSFIGQTTQAGRPLFALSQAEGLSAEELAKLERKLAAAVYLEEASA